MRRLRHRLRGIDQRDDIYLIDVTEQWNDNVHAFWAFTGAAWFAWGRDGGPVPGSLARISIDEPVTVDAPPDERVSVVVGGAIRKGAFVGRGG